MREFVQLVSLLLELIIWAVIIRAILSWFYPVGKDPITKLLVDVTDPILAPIRAIMSRLIPIPIDLSPIVLILLLNLLQGMLLQSARNF